MMTDWAADRNWAVVWWCPWQHFNKSNSDALHFSFFGISHRTLDSERNSYYTHMQIEKPLTNK